MWRCPVCEKEQIQGLVCDNCGFDASCDYEQNRTLFSDLSGHTEPISVRAAKWRQQKQAVAIAPGALVCPKCGGKHLSFLIDDLKFVCKDCGANMPISVGNAEADPAPSDTVEEAPPSQTDTQPPVVPEEPPAPADIQPPIAPEESSSQTEPQPPAGSEEPRPSVTEEAPEASCPWCGGTGKEAIVHHGATKKQHKKYWASTQPCSVCQGTGRVTSKDAAVTQGKVDIHQQYLRREGKKIDPSCPCCSGRGIVNMTGTGGILTVRNRTTQEPCPRCGGSAVEFPVPARKRKAITLLLFPIGMYTGAHYFYEGRIWEGCRYLLLVFLVGFTSYFVIPLAPIIFMIWFYFYISGFFTVLFRGKRSYMMAKGREVYDWERAKPVKIAHIYLTRQEAQRGCKKIIFLPNQVTPHKLKLRPGTQNNMTETVLNVRFYGGNGTITRIPVKTIVHVE